MDVLRNIVVSLCFAGQLPAETLNCPDPLLQVTGGDATLRARTCKVASGARMFLESCGVALRRTVEIEIQIVKTFDEQYTSCLGLYHCGENRIEILSPQGMSFARNKEGAFKLISDDAYWDSILVHELTHAAYDKVECPFFNCIVTSEYASFAMQVLSLPKDQRSLFGQTVTLRSKPSDDSISETMLFLSPSHFATLVWLHFQDRNDPCEYMQQIMAGQVFFDQ
ncbi:hypothetical protein MUY35_01175 [Aliiroseovarius sp. S1339]|uniref:DUF6639 family protein n=1 Tax=Aliiroseovarius sp. S1339 TaxID=2936990 RepID=UPI0020C0B9C1|nr:DUF6639 family protein [Aliiroseovarius sp. S1339]MCK8462458.1 hypothetical protein [Aliiroseovarius sp. S1339]